MKWFVRWVCDKCANLNVSSVCFDSDVLQVGSEIYGTLKCEKCEGLIEIKLDVQKVSGFVKAKE